MRYAIIDSGPSGSFAPDDPLRAGAGPMSQAEIVICLAGAPLQSDPAKTALLVELGSECLGYHTGEALGDEGSNILGFARYRNGADAPSRLVELVRQKNTAPAAIAAAKSLFEAAGLLVSVCTDQAGRIVDRLVRPKYNAALRLLDEAVASQHDIDLTCKLGLGYPDGPIERTVRGGLAHHHAICKTLFEIHGTPAYAPARRSVVASQRGANLDA